MSQVKATQTGYYGSKRRDPDEEFGLSDRADFTSVWMEPIGWTPGDPLDHDGDGKKGGSKPSGKPTVAERIALARDLSGRDDITTAKEADAILDAAGGTDI